MCDGGRIYETRGKEEAAPRSCTQVQGPPSRAFRPNRVPQASESRAACRTKLEAGRGGHRGNGQGWTGRKARLCSQECLPWLLKCLSWSRETPSTAQGLMRRLSLVTGQEWSTRRHCPVRRAHLAYLTTPLQGREISSWLSFLTLWNKRVAYKWPRAGTASEPHDGSAGTGAEQWMNPRCPPGLGAGSGDSGPDSIC